MKVPALLFAACIAAPVIVYADETPVRSPVVKMGDTAKTGHGTGFYVGTFAWPALQGYTDLYITAAHVLIPGIPKDNGVVRIEYSDGKETAATTILVLDAFHDFAVVASKDPLRPDKAIELDCDGPPAVGTEITANGYPGDLPLIRTKGIIASAPAQFGDWAEVMFADMTVAPGISGGPAMSEGRAIGVMVGWLAPTGFSVIIPANKICDWMGLE